MLCDPCSSYACSTPTLTQWDNFLDVGGRWPICENHDNIVAYNDDQPGNLSRITLSWMIEECQEHVKFIDSVDMRGDNRGVQDDIDIQAKIHDPLIKHSLGGYFWRTLEFFSCVICSP
jgi:hypothetical protein